MPIETEDRQPPAAIAATLKDIGHLIGGACPPGWGFALFMFDFGEGANRTISYISNADRESMVKTLREFLGKLEG